jgi:hypothetical protein
MSWASSAGVSIWAHNSCFASAAISFATIMPEAWRAEHTEPVGGDLGAERKALSGHMHGNESPRNRPSAVVEGMQTAG